MVSMTLAVYNRLRPLVSIVAQTVLALLVGMWLVGIMTGRGWERIVALVTQGFTVLLTLADPLMGFLFWLVLAPFAPFWNFNIAMGRGIPDISLVRTGTLVVAFVLLAQLAAGRRRLPPLGWTEIGMVIFVGGMVIATRMAIKGMIFALQTAFDAYVVPMMVYFFARIMITDERKLNRMINVLFFIGLYIAFIALHESWTGEMWFYPWGRSGLYTRTLRRVTGLLGDPAYHTTIMNVLLPVAIYRYVRSQDRLSSWVYLGWTGLFLLTIGFLYTRAGYVAAFLTMSLMAVRFPRWRRIFVPALVVGAAVLAASWGRFVHSEFYQRRLNNQASVNSRAQAIRAAVDMWRRSPLFGIGYPNYGILALREGYFVQIDDKWRPAPHNTFFGILSQAGIIALSGYVLMLLGMAREIVTRYRQLRREVEGRVRGLWRSTVGIDTSPHAISGWAVVGLDVLLVYTFIMTTIDADPAQFTNLVFYTLIGGILGYMAHTYAHAHSPMEEA